MIVGQAIASWMTALENVAGVYVISDAQYGKLYVGSATGEGGLWQRWSSYCATGHGGNVELARLLKECGPERANHFSFSVVEIADTHTSAERILERETYRK